MSKLRKLAELPRSDLVTLLRAAVLLMYANLRLPSLDFRPDPTGKLSAPASASSASMQARARAIARLVGIAAAYCPVKVTCLHHALVLWQLLRQDGIPCALRIGVRRESELLDAHAWVECAGKALNEPYSHLEGYSQFDVAIAPVALRHAWSCFARRA